MIRSKRTVRIELEDLQVHVCVCDDKMKLLFKGEEVDGYGFETVL